MIDYAVKVWRGEGREAVCDMFDISSLAELEPPPGVVLSHVLLFICPLSSPCSPDHGRFSSLLVAGFNICNCMCQVQGVPQKV